MCYTLLFVLLYDCLFIFIFPVCAAHQLLRQHGGRWQDGDKLPPVVAGGRRRGQEQRQCHFRPRRVDHGGNESVHHSPAGAPNPACLLLGGIGLCIRTCFLFRGFVCFVWFCALLRVVLNGFVFIPAYVAWSCPACGDYSWFV